MPMAGWGDERAPIASLSVPSNDSQQRVTEVMSAVLRPSRYFFFCFLLPRQPASVHWSGVAACECCFAKAWLNLAGAVCIFDDGPPCLFGSGQRAIASSAEERHESRC